MEIKKEKLEQIINQSANPSRLEPEQIPELELYIDQILMLFEDKLRKKTAVGRTIRF